VRTLTTDNPRYNPVGYHIGTVWPHDNSILAAGLRRYGRDDEAARLCDSMLEACTWFESMSMPELFAGFSREEYERPVPYPVACRPQAWGAGAVLGMLHTLLGLVPDAFAGRLRIVRPRLPALARALRLEGLRVGDARVDLRFHRVGADVDVELLHKEGPLEVVVEQGTGARTLGGWV
jgi:glycogen debranching enzyme